MDIKNQECQKKNCTKEIKNCIFEIRGHDGIFVSELNENDDGIFVSELNENDDGIFVSELNENDDGIFVSELNENGIYVSDLRDINTFEKQKEEIIDVLIIKENNVE